ncbi:MAG: hypothetical protein K0A89_07350 [ANME-2 cluster archaeon]|nr:hypothetical protein [ANME-2 cluster archaeon]
MNTIKNNGTLFAITMLVLLITAGLVSGASTVPTDISIIISNNCANCHADRPATHTDATPGGQNSDQCGLCHIPYGNTATFVHTATTTGCISCHATVETTHFFLRDDNDQTKLADSAEGKCISCHVENGGSGFTTGPLAVGKGFPPLQTDEEIIAAAQQGTLRSWIQPGGFMAKYLTDDEVATITDWIDSTYTNDRSLGYDPYLDAVKTTDFDINDLVTGTDNAAWDKATEHVISVTPTIYTSADKIKLKALYSDEYLYIRAEWDDTTASLTRADSWVKDSSTGKWRHPATSTGNDKQSEDRFAVFWNIDTQNYKARYGCAISCHGNVPGSAKFTDTSGATMDIWHNKAARGLGVFSATDSDLVIAGNEAFEATAGTVKLSGVVDDKRLIWYMDTNDGYDTEDSGRRADKGKSAYSNNRNGDKSAPKVIETAPTSWSDAMVLTQAEIDNGQTITADPNDAAYDAAAVDEAWNNYEDLSAVVPERILREPDGSRGDVLNTAVWKDGVWTQEFRRKLVTGNADDVQFDLATATEYDYSVAVFDNCGRGEIPPGHTTYGEGQYQILRFSEEAPAPSQTKSTPGFEGLFMIAGLLTVGYLVLKRKE